MSLGGSTSPSRVGRAAARPRFIALGAAIGAVMLVAGMAVAGVVRPTAAPTRAMADIAPGSACDSSAGDGTANAVACDLWAKTGSLDLPGLTVDIWGYAADELAPAGVPGPTIIVDEGDAVSILLHNQLADASSLSLRGQSLEPDMVGASPGGTQSYDFIATEPGTYVYEAGLTDTGDRQVAMGLYGALIVRPTSCTGCAYPGVAFDDESLLVLSEVDPRLNANPASFSMHDWAPTYWLINGKAYPDTDPIMAGAGQGVLLRYVNAGLSDHSMGVLGLRQQVVARDGFAMAQPYSVVAETVPAGSTLDTIAAIPTSADDLSELAVMNMAGHLDNAGRASAGQQVPIGGQLTFIQVLGVGGAGGGPLTTNVQVDPNPTTGGAVELTADITGGGTVDAAEYFIDTIGASGSGTAMDAFSPAASVAVSVTIDTSALALQAGLHQIYVHGRNTDGVWGPVDSVELNLDADGPSVSSVTFDPNPAKGDTPIAITGTASDADNGGAPVVGAEYFVDGTGSDGSGTAMTLTNPGAVVSEITGTIAAPLSEGVHTVSIHALDCAGPGCLNGTWGAFTNVPLVIDQTGPSATAVVITPNPNNGTLTYDINKFAAKLSAVAADPLVGGAQTTISAVEGFIDSAGPTGSGFLFLPADGWFDEVNEPVYVEIPLSGILALPEGTHTLLVHARDAAGNWGAFGTATLTVDKTGPALSGVSAAPNPTNGASSATLSGTATDPSTVIAAEWFDGADPGSGNGGAMSGAFGGTSVGVTAMINVGSWSAGVHSLGVRARDKAGNWGPVTRYELTVAPPDLLFANGFGLTGLSGWTSSSGNVAVLASGEPSARSVLHATIAGGNGGYVVKTLAHSVSSFHARFRFNPRGAKTAAAGHTIFAAVDGTGATVFEVLYKHSGTAAKLRLAVRHAGGLKQTTWLTIGANETTSIEIAWLQGPKAAQRLYLNGQLRATLSKLNTSGRVVAQARMGALGLLTGASGVEEFDDFVSTQQSLIGP